MSDLEFERTKYDESKDLVEFQTYFLIRVKSNSTYESKNNSFNLKSEQTIIIEIDKLKDVKGLIDIPDLDQVIDSNILSVIEKKVLKIPKMAAKPAAHFACRSSNLINLIKYQVAKNQDQISRPYVPDDKISWDEVWRDYKPIKYTSDSVKSGPAWADPMNPKMIKNWNAIDGNIDRRSHHGDYNFNENGLPLNPVGRTGIEERGLLGKWGPNHAADPIVTRWKINKNGVIEINPNTKKKILQFVAIERKDTNEWAIPGGMCDPGEKISQTLKREFMEEALNSEALTKEQHEEFHRKLSSLFSDGKEIYRGYVDDPRNTDNAWMETIAYNFHDDTGLFQSIELIAGDDAAKVKWMDIDSGLKLYASHKNFIQEVAKLHDSNW